VQDALARQVEVDLRLVKGWETVGTAESTLLGLFFSSSSYFCG
jgi:hypothetical protein